jgi:menaquinol-cytochrome c reductase iron-sulfur subunit
MIRLNLVKGRSMFRRDFFRMTSQIMGAVIAAVVAIPGAAYVLSPLRKRATVGGFDTLTRLSQLEVGVPRSFAIIEERMDAWVKYPREPVGSVWLIRQPKGSTPEVLALSSECPHVGCAVSLAAGGKSFVCPCHTSAFELDGSPRNKVPPRGMDTLEVEIEGTGDPEVRVRYQRFRAETEEKIPLV